MYTFERTAKYYETDQMGIVHHSNYIRWFEEARIDLMDQLGLPYRKMEERKGLVLALCNRLDGEGDGEAADRDFLRHHDQLPLPIVQAGAGVVIAEAVVRQPAVDVAAQGRRMRTKERGS